MVVDVNKENFESEVTNSSVPVVLDFWAEWCGPCRNIAPMLKEISEQRKDVKIVKINVDENSELSMQYKIQSIPTLILIKNGEILDTKMGSSSISEISNWINKNIV